MKKWRVYAFTSIGLMAAAVGHALLTRDSFFTAALHLVVWRLTQLVVLNFGFFVELCAAMLVKRLFLGTLEDRETETLRDRLMLETIEALFFGGFLISDAHPLTLLVLVVQMLFLKGFHYIVEHRIDWTVLLQPQPQQPGGEGGGRQQRQLPWARTRLFIFVLILLAIDIKLSITTWRRFLSSNDFYSEALFAFEYSLLAALALYSVAKFVIATVDAAHDGHWERRPEATLYAEVIHSTLQFVATATLFTVVLVADARPWYIVRRLYNAFVQLRVRISDLRAFRRMNVAVAERFPLVALAEIPRADPTCIVCREDMVHGRLLPCGHILHEHCLRSWLTHQQRCPICQHPVMQDHPANPAAAIFAARPHAAAAAAPAADAVAAPPPQQQQQQQQAAADGGADGAAERGQRHEERDDTLESIVAQMESIKQRIEALLAEAAALSEVVTTLAKARQQPPPPQNQVPAAVAPPGEQDTDEIRRRRLQRFQGESQ